MMEKRGFTLIELLIVVAIIAILAAIAVPNFLEAQTRSRVSRVKSDQRTMATAIELYQVDQGVYPLPWFSSSQHPGGRLHGAFQLLTTPIAYVTSIPEDPFLPPNNPGISSTPPPYRSFKYYMYDAEAYAVAWGTAPNWTDTSRADSPFRDELYKYLMLSLGPDYEGESALPRTPFMGQANGVSYDPTNGTVSKGDIYRFGPGGNPAGYY